MKPVTVNSGAGGVMLARWMRRIEDSTGGKTTGDNFSTGADDKVQASRASASRIRAGATLEEIISFYPVVFPIIYWQAHRPPVDYCSL